MRDANDEKYNFMVDINQQTEPIINEKLNQHCGRAILMINPNSDEDEKEAEKAQQIYDFLEIIKISQKINSVLTKLILYGHYDYIKYNSNNFQIIIEPQPELNFMDQLQKLHKDYSTEFKEWKKNLLRLRKQYYCLNYISNKQIPLFLDFIITPNIQNYKLIQYTIKSINKNFNFKMFEDILSTYQTLNEPQNIDEIEICF